MPQFMAVLAIARDPARYGFDEVDLDDPMAFDEVALRARSTCARSPPPARPIST